MTTQKFFRIGFVIFLLPATIAAIGHSRPLGSPCSIGEDCGDSGFICKNETCSYCEYNSECSSQFGPSMICKTLSSNKEKVCRHKDILPVNYLDAVVSILIFVGGAFAAGGGIGGGGVFVPLLILVGRFDPEEAIPLSTVLIGGASVANFFQMVRKKQANRNKPLIDYNLAMLLQPLSLAGTIVGVILNIIFPSWLLLMLLVLVLFITLWRTLIKGWKLWKQEKRLSLMDLHQGRSSNIQTEFLLQEDPVYADPDLNAIVAEEKSTPILPFVVMAFVLTITSILSLLRGSTRGRSVVGIKPCSPVYWVLSFSPLPLLVAIAIGICWYLVKRHKRHLQHNYKYQVGDVVYTPLNTGIMATASIVAGLLAGLLGIGGGMVFGPLMLEFKMLPEVAAATSSFMILFTSIAAIIQYAILGRLILDYSLWFVMLGFVCSFLGQFVLTKVVQKYHKTSLIVLCVSVVIAISMVLLITIGIMNIMEDVKAGLSFGFRSAC